MLLFPPLKSCKKWIGVLLSQILPSTFQRLEDELSKKREELRDLLLLPTAPKKASSVSGAEAPRKDTAPPLIKGGSERSAAAGSSSSASAPAAAACPSPLNLSAESGIDNAERSSSVDSALSKVREISFAKVA